MRYILLLISVCVQLNLSSQTDSPFIYEGIITDSRSQKPLAYCNVSNMLGSKGTISNTQGYFKIRSRSAIDTLVLSFIGYHTSFIKITDDQVFLEVSLKEKENKLPTALVTPKSKEFLYDLIQACRRTENVSASKAKAYYELKSTINEQQIELVESFYNATTNNYNLNELDIKAGRLGLKRFEDRLFASIENSKAIVMHTTIEENAYFLPSPIELSKRKCKKSFSVDLENKYLDQTEDSVYVISFFPKPDLLGFSGKLWLNKTQKTIMKLELECEDCKVHPFLPLFTSDTISEVQLRIYKTFKTIHDKTQIDFIDFTCDYNYNSRNKKNYHINSEAILYLYEYDGAFDLPLIDLPKRGITDYARINAMPYNSFFWENNDEYHLNQQKAENDKFFNNDSTLTNKKLFEHKAINKKSNFFQYPFIHWTGNRFFIQEMTEDTVQLSLDHTAFLKEYYNLQVEVYLDVNSYNDSTHIVTSTFINPLETYYHLKMDENAHCSLNIFFDLVEIERRRFMEELDPNLALEEIAEAHDHLNLRIHNLKKIYFTQVNRGSNIAMLTKWNDLVNEELSINNMYLFGINTQ